jgi:2-polyprenyl-3-methyl-5-hydroxy-6-metoxy-1,4-benzoquinol methylase
MPEVRKYAGEIKKLAGLLYQPFLKELKALNATGRYLEIGAGPGLLAIMIAENNPHVHITAVDISPDMVAVANEYIQARKLQNQIRYLQVDVNDKHAIQELGKYDLVYSTFSMHHWKDPATSIINLWGAVGDNGRLYIYDFTRVWWLYYLPLKNGDIGSIRASFTASELKDIVQKIGLPNYKIRSFFPFFLRLNISKK